MQNQVVHKGDYVVFRDAYLGICCDDRVDHDRRLCEVYSEVHTYEYIPADYLEKLYVSSKRFQSMLNALREQLSSKMGRNPYWPKKLLKTISRKK